MKKFKQTIIIREKDLCSLMYKSIKKDLFDSIEVEPLTYQEIQNEILVKVLTGVATQKYSPLPDVYEAMLYKEGNLYNRRYLDWTLTMDYPAGQIYVQSRAAEPKDPLYRVTFQNDHG